MPLRIDVSKFPYHDHDLSSKIQFVHVAYYHRVKDQLTMFRAFAQVAETIDCELTVVGQGFDREEVRELLKELYIANKVHFVGVVMNDKLSEIFSRMHILLHTSRYEAECAVIMEAMASGVVVCGTRVGFLADNGTGLAVVVPPANPTELPRAVLDLLRDPNKYKLLKMTARKYIEEHSADWSSQEYQALLNHLVHSTGHKKL
jgi:glycosyltransferase involved in cell wall biosynthesis